MNGAIDVMIECQDQFEKYAVLISYDRIAEALATGRVVGDWYGDPGHQKRIILVNVPRWKRPTVERT